MQLFIQQPHTLYCTNDFWKGLKIQWTEIQSNQALYNILYKKQIYNILHVLQYSHKFLYKSHKMKNWKINAF